MATPDQNAADKIGRAIDGQIFRLQEERAKLLPAVAAARVAEIDAEILVLQNEKTRIDPRRSVVVPPIVGTGVDSRGNSPVR